MAGFRRRLVADWWWLRRIIRGSRENFAFAFAFGVCFSPALFQCQPDQIHGDNIAPFALFSPSLSASRFLEGPQRAPIVRQDTYKTTTSRALLVHTSTTPPAT